MLHKCVRYDFFFSICYKIVVLFAVVLEIVTQGLCLYMTTPRATSRKTAPFYITRIRYSDIFVNFVHEFVGYFASNCKMCENSLIFTTKLYQEFVKSRT